MTKRLASGGAMLAVLILAAFAATSNLKSVATSPTLVVEYLRAVPPGPTGIRCHKVCVKFGRAAPTHPAVCLQWRMVC
jgi:acyl-coenzyme A thioesterase PaaI-like protein